MHLTLTSKAACNYFYALVSCIGFTVCFVLHDLCRSILKPVCSPIIVPGKFDYVFCMFTYEI